MIAVIDACALYPTVLRQILFGVAERGLFSPIWSARLLEEWTRAAARNGGAMDKQIAMAEGTSANLRFPNALTAPGDEIPLWLPDPADIHVLPRLHRQPAAKQHTVFNRRLPWRIVDFYCLGSDL